MNKTISIVVKGTVQGVWFRKYTLDKAVELGITGYVKNMPDESVYIFATGTEDQLKLLCQWCYTGSPKSKVTEVVVKQEEFTLTNGFNIER
jgi:acylphosphatase